MDILKFRVRGQALTLINPNVNLIPVTDTVNQYLCQFEFSEDWDDLNKVVVFKNVSYNITKEVYLSTSNECYIPWEVLSNSGDIFLEVIGTEVRGEVVTVRIPSTLLGFKWEIQEGLLDVSANVSPTPDLFEQFVSSVRSDSIVAATARDEAVIARGVAVQSAADASASELAATSAAESAVNSASTASSAASSASESALSVAGVADETKSYAEIASAKAADASTQAEIAAGAKEDAVIAKAGAEAARDEAATSADLAQTTESHIKTMTVSAHSLAETEAPTVTKTDTSTGFALDFGIPKGATGPKGEDGDNIHYTWVKYADTPTSGMSDNPTGKAYIGIAYNKSTPVGSTVYSDYAWSRIKGETGEDGYSPTVIIGTASDGSTTLTVTNKDGSNTTELVDGKARADIDNLEIGGRNLLVSSYPHISGNTKDGYTNRGWASSFMLNDNLVKMLEPSTEYIIRYKYRVDSVKEGTTAQTMNAHGVFLLYSANGYPYTWLFDTSIDTMAEANSWNVGDIVERKTTFTTPANLHDADAAYEILYYTSRRMKGTTYVLNDEGTFFDIKIEKGNKATDWTPAPEDVDANIQSVVPNILLNSGFKSNAGGWDNSVDITDYVIKDGRRCAHINFNALKGAKYVKQSVLGKLEPNTQYTISLWVLTENVVKGTTNFTCRLMHDGYYNNNGTNTWYSYFVKEYPLNAGEWTHFECTFTTDNTKLLNSTDSNIYVYARDMTGDIYFCDLTLVKGYKVTEWTPAPADTLVSLDPPIMPGDTINMSWYGASFITSSATQTYIEISLRRPIFASNVSCTMAALQTRQNGVYTHGSDGSVNVPWEVTSCLLTEVGIRLLLTNSTTTNALNNEPIGIRGAFTFKFS